MPLLPAQVGHAGVRGSTYALIDVVLVDVHSSLWPWKVLVPSNCVASSLTFFLPTTIALKSRHKLIGAVSTGVKPKWSKQEGVVLFQAFYRIHDTSCPSHNTRPSLSCSAKPGQLMVCHSLRFDVNVPSKKCHKLPKDYCLLATEW